mgnify:CR=1 FL=1
MSAFVLNRGYELQLPNSYVDIDNDEMEYVDGGSVSLPVKSSYLNRQNCIVTAAGLINGGKVSGMTLHQIAAEIYAHAMAYYCSPVLIGIGISRAEVNNLIIRANPIDIADGGDTSVRRALYNTIWFSADLF